LARRKGGFYLNKKIPRKVDISNAKAGMREKIIEDKTRMKQTTAVLDR